MESPEGVAAKRRVLVDALTMCLSRSKVCPVVDVQTIHSVLETASTELWREGEFRLEYVWKILCQQPGLTAKEVAPPLLVFKAYETELGVNVRLPQALSSIPRGEQVKLRDELGITKADFAKSIAELNALAQAEQAKAEASATSQERRPEAGKPAPQEKATSYAPSKPKPERKRLAVALSAVAAVALSIGLYFGLRNTAQGMDLRDVAPLLQLADAVRDGASMTAVIADPKWATWSKAERERVVGQVFDAVSQKGVHALTLVDGSRKQRAVISDAGGSRLVIVYP